MPRFRLLFGSGCWLLALLWGIGLQNPCLAAPPAGYYQVWADEFNGTNLNLTYWKHWLTGARRDAVNTPGAVSFNGSNMVITTSTTNGVHYTGMVSTESRLHFKYGFFESRINYDDQPGMWSAYWMQSPTMGSYIGNAAYAGTEIDICEHRKVDSSNANVDGSVVANIHWDGYGASHKSTGSGLIGSGLGAGFHVYGLLWDDNSYAVWIDGAQRWTTGTAVSRRTEFMIFSSEVQNNSWAGTIPAGGYTSPATYPRMYIDYLRYYAPTSMVFWSGGGGTNASWTNALNWLAGRKPHTGADVVFSFLSTNSNLKTSLDGELALRSLTVNEVNGSVTIGGGGLNLGSGGLDMTSARSSVVLDVLLTLDQSQTWTVGANRTLTVNSNISGNAGLTLDGYGTLSLFASNAIRGDFRVKQGTLRLEHESALYHSTLDLNSADAGSVTAIAPTHRLGGLKGSRGFAFGTDSLYIGYNNQPTAFAGTLAGAGSVSKVGTGTLTFSGSNALTGYIYVRSGALQASHTNALGTSTAGTIVLSNAQLSLQGAGLSSPIYEPLSLAGNSQGVYAAPLRVGGASTPPLVLAGQVSLVGEATIQLDGGRSLILSNASNLSGNGLTLAGDGGSYGEIKQGVVVGKLVKSGGGTWVLSGPGTSGELRVAGGVLSIQHPGALSRCLVDLDVGDSGTLALNNLNAVLGGLKGSRPLALGSGKITLGDNNRSTFYSGTLSGAGSLDKIGQGSQTLAGASSYSGPTTIWEGALEVANAAGSATGLGLVIVQTNGTLCGTGLVSGPVIVRGTLSPGGYSGGTGRLTTGAQAWLPGAEIRWEIRHESEQGGADTLQINGSLSLNATPEQPAILRLVTLGVDGLPGALSGFDSQSKHAWVIGSASGGITGFNPYATRVDSTGWSNALNGGAFSLAISGNDLVLRFQPASDPPQIVAIGMSNGSFIASVTGVPGRVYALTVNSNLAIPEGWQPLVNRTADIAGAVLLADPRPVPPWQSFYRIQLIP